MGSPSWWWIPSVSINATFKLRSPGEFLWFPQTAGWELRQSNFLAVHTSIPKTFYDNFLKSDAGNCASDFDWMLVGTVNNQSHLATAPQCNEWDPDTTIHCWGWWFQNKSRKQHRRYECINVCCRILIGEGSCQTQVHSLSTGTEQQQTWQ